MKKEQEDIKVLLEKEAKIAQKNLDNVFASFWREVKRELLLKQAIEKK